MGVEEQRQATAAARRRLIIETMAKHLNPTNVDSPLARFRASLESETPRIIIANADIDGVLSAAMLHSATGWNVGVLVDKTGLRVHPELDLPALLEQPELVIGVDVFSHRFMSISNHPVYFGARPRDSVTLQSQLANFDQTIRAGIADNGTINLSAWVGIEARQGAESKLGMPYKYPLGTAQVMLACLELAGRAPKFYDREFLPGLVAHADGGLDTIRNYEWNAAVWWSALAATVGPTSMSEQLFKLARAQRPGMILNLFRHLRFEMPEHATAVNQNLNIIDSKPESIAAVVSLVDNLSCWGDPILGGADELDSWKHTSPTKNVVNVSDLTTMPQERLAKHLDGALRAVHSSFSVFRERGTALGWMLATQDSQTEAALGPFLGSDEAAGPLGE